MIDPDQIQIGTLLKFKANKEDTDLYALVIDIDDDQINPLLFHLLVGEQTYWQYIKNVGWEIVK